MIKTSCTPFTKQAAEYSLEHAEACGLCGKRWHAKIEDHHALCMRSRVAHEVQLTRICVRCIAALGCRCSARMAELRDR